ncbi:GAF domain-containing protein [Phormidium sp. FACHB-592]|uniref:histidine kinase n=1 Tax=Stenomitos frigidus AS-A4 TaxID=2933935 RepID=A0ABV0KD37_9CYAN|nr:GAF domain-containing protein [Phormidium sp. FACHB-592]MBD2077738.1 GAF domain-containing protein [Phormidium sp. FACHB-592]
MPTIIELNVQILNDREPNPTDLEPRVTLAATPLKPNGEWLSLLDHASPVGIFRTTGEGQITYVNQRWCEITGVTVAHGSDWLQTIHQDDRERVTTEWQQATQSVPLECFQSRYRFQRSNSTVWVFVQVVANYDSDGTLSGYVGTTTDITQRQQAEETLWQQTERERLVAAIVQEIRRHLDLSHVLKTTVTEVRRLLQTDRVLFFRFESDWSGIVLVESVGTDWKSIQGENIVDPCFAESYVCKYRDGHTRAVSNIRTEYHQSSCYVEMLASFQVNAELVVPILQNDELWGLLIAHHCSETRHWQTWETDLLKQLAAQVSIAIQQSELYQEVQRLNAELEQQVQTRTAQLQLAFNFEATLKRIADRVRDSLDEDQILQTAVRELAGAIKVRSCNAALYDLTQRTSTVRYEYTTSVAPIQGRIVQMDNFKEGYGQLLQGQYFQFCSLLPNSERGRSAMFACPILDDQGVLGDLWLVSNNERIFAEQDIRLVQQVANQCAIALRQARLYQASQAQVEALEKLNRLKDDFLSTVSHELRTPMANIKMAAQMLEIVLRRDKLLDADAGSLPRYFQILNSECQREIKLINDLLDLSRLEMATEPLLLTALSLQSWLPNIVKPFSERINSQQQHLEVVIPTTLAPLTTDQSYLERIITELLSNACKYTPAHGQIAIVVAVEPTNVRFEISNTGIEIAASDRDRVFEKFYRIPNNDPWKHGGTGLGLALTKKLVETLGGSIRVTSKAGLTTFIVELPMNGVGS